MHIFTLICNLLANLWLNETDEIYCVITIAILTRISLRLLWTTHSLKLPLLSTTSSDLWSMMTIRVCWKHFHEIEKYRQFNTWNMTTTEPLLVSALRVHWEWRQAGPKEINGSKKIWCQAIDFYDAKTCQEKSRLVFWKFAKWGSNGFCVQCFTAPHFAL